MITRNGMNVPMLEQTNIAQERKYLLKCVEMYAALNIAAEMPEKRNCTSGANLFPNGGSTANTCCRLSVCL